MKNLFDIMTNTPARVPEKAYTLRLLSRLGDSLSEYHDYFMKDYEETPEHNIPAEVIEITTEIIALWKELDDVAFLFRKKKRPRTLLSEIALETLVMTTHCGERTASLEELVDYRALLSSFTTTFLENEEEMTREQLRESSREALESCVVS